MNIVWLIKDGHFFHKISLGATLESPSDDLTPLFLLAACSVVKQLYLQCSEVTLFLLAACSVLKLPYFLLAACSVLKLPYFLLAACSVLKLPNLLLTACSVVKLPYFLLPNLILTLTLRPSTDHTLNLLHFLCASFNSLIIVPGSVPCTWFRTFEMLTSTQLRGTLPRKL